jgi:glycosyltransferase involved in cell wall biosynthesis
MSGKKVVIVTSGQPSLNPRVVKEADALTEAGYLVTVLYAYWNDWGTQHDEQLFAEKKWRAIRIGGDPKQKPLSYFFSRLIYKTDTLLLRATGCYSCFAELAVARSNYFLIKEAKKHQADLYIAHNLGALPAAVKAAKLNKSRCGFDAEDFHRQEVTDDINSHPYKISKYIEDEYLPLTDYITASSPLIAERYTSLYKSEVTAMLNVFPKTTIPAIIYNENKSLKLFWFSQTIGPNRGLEMIIEAMKLTVGNIELHLLGQVSESYKQNLLHVDKAIDVTYNHIYFYEPVKAEAIFRLASRFDIGLASEVASTCLNRDISLTNKIFTYLQSGLALTASNTTAQSEFLNQYPQTGRIYKNAKELSLILNEYDKNRELLFQTKKESFKVGQTQLNWENEGRKFLSVVEKVLAN